MQPWRLLLLLPLLLVMPTGHAALDVARGSSIVQQQALDADSGGSSTVQQQAPASNLCALLQSNVCATEVAIPTGYVLRSCGPRNTTCGITITTTVSKPCSDADAAQMLELRQTLGTACMCAAKLEGVQEKAPSLMQQGTLSVKNPFHGVCNEVLMGATAAAFCVTGAAGAKARASSQSVLDELANQKPLKPLAGIHEFLSVTAPAVDPAKWQQLGEAARSCPLVVTAATADSTDTNATSSSSSTAAQPVPAGCEDLVRWFGAFAGPSLTSLIPLVGEAMSSFLSFLTEARAAALDISAQVKPLLLPDSWQAFLASAAAAAADLYCAAPGACFSGQLSQLWASLQQVPAALDGQHAALRSLQRLAALAEDAMPQAQQVKCAAGRKQQATDSEGLQADVFGALLRASARQQVSAGSAANSSAGAQSVMTQEEVLQLGPRLLPMMMVELAGLTHLQDLEGPIRALRGQAAIVKQDVESALKEYADRAQSALKDIAALKYMLLAQLPSGSDDSTNGNSSRPASALSGTQSLAGTLPPAGSSVLSADDVAGALDVLKAWLDLLRKDPSLMQGATHVKDDLLPQLWGGIDRLFAEVGSGPDSREPWLFRSGLLTYNRQARLQGTLPCIKGRSRKCFSHRAGQRTFSACMSYPRVAANCSGLGQVVQLPNEFIPWVAVHAGLIPALNQAHDAITPYWRPSNQTGECA